MSKVIRISQASKEKLDDIRFGQRLPSMDAALSSALDAAEATDEGKQRIKTFQDNCLRIGIHSAMVTLAQYHEGGDEL